MISGGPISSSPISSGPLAATNELRATQTSVRSLSESLGSLRASQSVSRAVINFPTDSLRASQTTSRDVVKSGPTLRSSQVIVRSLVRGAVDNPKLRAWYYTLDGHDFWVLKLGTNDKTFVYDLSTGQWSWWTSNGNNRWSVNIGMNWYSAGTIPHAYGSNVIVGDDTSGNLWVLNAEQGVDNGRLSGDADLTFPRVATGQMVTKARQFLPVFSVHLRASQAQPALTANTVTLSYSDDSGQTFTDADEPIVVLSDDYNQEYDWKSLGMVRAPGRLFRISDDGSFARIDSLDVNE